MKLGIENTTSFSHVTHFFHIQVRPDLETDFQTHISSFLDLLSDCLDYEQVEPKWYFDIGLRSIPIDGVRWKSRYFFLAKDVASRWASNYGPFHGNYRDKFYLTPGDGQLHAYLR